MSGKKDSFWFKHDSNARNDIKVVRLRLLYGWSGYGAFFALVECLREERHNRIAADDMDALLQSMQIERSVFDAIVDVGLLRIASGYVFSDSLDGRMKEWNKLTKKRREAGKVGGSRPRAEAKPKQMLSKPVANAKQMLSDMTGSDLTGSEETEKKPLHPEACRLAGLLVEAIRKWKQDAMIPKSTASWESDIDRMLRLDNRKPETIEAVLKWLPTDNFWPQNIRSASKLRKQFDSLEAKMKPSQHQHNTTSTGPRLTGWPEGMDEIYRPRWGSDEAAWLKAKALNDAHHEEQRSKKNAV